VNFTSLAYDQACGILLMGRLHVVCDIRRSGVNGQQKKEKMTQTNIWPSDYRRAALNNLHCSASNHFLEIL